MLIRDDGADRPANFARKLELAQPYVSKLLYQLERRGLVECYTEDKKSWRIYNVTNLGLKVLEEMEKEGETP
jgi:DNA-binding MarR family transcriptional regulator